jgi:hypothetical protein
MKKMCLVVGILFSLGWSTLTRAQYPPVTLVSTGAVWKYLDDGSDPGPNWTEPTWPPFSFFDDSAWHSGPAQLGYGDGDEATMVRPGTNQNTRAITTYFRHAFDITNYSVTYSNLVLRVLRDDGVIVYLNGGEIFRNNMPPGPATPWTLASANAADENAFLTASVPIGFLLYGPNMLAAEIHQVNVASTDISFDAELTAGVPEATQVEVTVHTTDAQAREPGVLAVVEHGQFAIRRTGAVGDPLTVFFTLGGTASNGVDYAFITNQVTIQAGATQALVNIAPLMDNTIEPTETVELTIVPPVCAAVVPPPLGCYIPGYPATASVAILETPGPTNPPPSITLYSPTNGAVFTEGANIGITVSVGNADGTVARVDFLVNGQIIGTWPDPLNYNMIMFRWTNVPAGAYTVAARAWDEQGLSQLSGVANILVNAATNPPLEPGEFLIGFNPASLPFGSRMISNWVESGFFFSTPDRMAHSDGGLSHRPDNGSAYLSFSSNQKPLTFRNTAGNLFSLLSMDLAEYSTVFPTPKNITVTGYKADNSPVTTVVQIDGVIDGPGGVADFQTFTFGSEFSQLDRVEVFPDIYSLDNVRVLVEGAPTNSVPPRTIVNVVAVDPVAGEPPHAAGPGKFSVRRSGDLSVSLNVLLTIGGSASNGVDYATIQDQVVIPAGAAETFVNVVPLMDSLIELTEQVVITLQPPVCIAIFPPPPECYLAGVSTSAVVTIISAAPTNAVRPVVSLYSPINGSTYPAGATVLLGANASGTSAVQRVDFLRGAGIIIGTSFAQSSAEGGWTLLWTNPPAGVHVLRAVATDLLGVRGTSAPVSIVVGSNSVPPLTPVVYLYASDPAAAEAGALAPPNPGRFTFRRYGPTNAALQVCFQISGTASNGLDYLIATNCVVILPGASNALVSIEPIDDGVAELTEVVVLKLLSSISYQMGQPSTATVLIADNDSLSPTNQPPFPRLTVLPQGSDAMATNGCRLVLEGDGPITCVIECSIDMVNWTPIYTNTLSGSAISFVDADVSSPRRFYRLVTQ